MASARSLYFDIAAALRHITELSHHNGAWTVYIVAKLVLELLSIYKYVLLGSVIISWVNADPYNPIVRFIRSITEPVLGKIRQFMPDTGMLDLSPLVAFFAIQMIQSAIIRYAQW
jgi:YggT family protein